MASPVPDRQEDRLSAGINEPYHFLYCYQGAREGKGATWGEADSPWCQQEREGESLSMVRQTVDKGQIQRSGGHLQMEGVGWGLPCGSCQLGGKVGPVPSTGRCLYCSELQSQFGERLGRIAGPQDGRNLPPFFPRLRDFVSCWAFFFRLTQWESANGNVLLPRVQACQRKKERARPCDCSSKRNCPRFHTPYSTGHPSRGTSWGARQGIYKHLEFYVLWGEAGLEAGGGLIPRKRTT